MSRRDRPRRRPPGGRPARERAAGHGPGAGAGSRAGGRRASPRVSVEKATQAWRVFAGTVVDPNGGAADDRPPPVPRPTRRARPRARASTASRRHAKGLLAWSDRRAALDRRDWSTGSRPRVRVGCRGCARSTGCSSTALLYVGGSPETRWARDLETNPHVSVHLDGGSDVAILEGVAELLEHGVGPELAQRLAAESTRKYPQYGMTADSYAGPGPVRDPSPRGPWRGSASPRT